MTGPRVIPPSPLAAPLRRYIVISGTADCVDGPRSHQMMEAPPWTYATSASHGASERCVWRTAETAPTAPWPRSHSLARAVLATIQLAEFEGGANRLGRARAVSAPLAMLVHSIAAKFEGPALGLGRADIRADGNFSNNSEEALAADAEHSTTRAMPLRLSVTRLRGASGRGYPLPAAPETRRSPSKFIVHRRATPGLALCWTATRGIVARAAARLGHAC